MHSPTWRVGILFQVSFAALTRRVRAIHRFGRRQIMSLGSYLCTQEVEFTILVAILGRDVPRLNILAQPDLLAPEEVEHVAPGRTRRLILPVAVIFPPSATALSFLRL